MDIKLVTITIIIITLSNKDNQMMEKFDSHLNLRMSPPLLTITITGVSIKERMRLWVERVNQFTNNNIYLILFLVAFLQIPLVVQLMAHPLDGKVNSLISLDSIVLACINITSLIRTLTRSCASCKSSASGSEKSNENQKRMRNLMHYPLN